MKITEHIAQAKGETLFSFEILPPKKGEDINALFSAIQPLMEFNPAFIDVTYHREEYDSWDLRCCNESFSSRCRTTLDLWWI